MCKANGFTTCCVLSWQTRKTATSVDTMRAHGICGQRNKAQALTQGKKAVSLSTQIIANQSNFVNRKGKEHLNISTLECIHKLLKDKTEEINKKEREAQKLLYELQESDTADESLIKKQETIANAYEKYYIKLVRALNDFVDQDW